MKKFLLAILLIPVLISAQGKYAVSISSGVYAPVATFNNFFNPSYGFSGSFAFSANSALNLSINTGYISFAFDNAAFQEDLGNDYPGVKTDLDVPLYVIPLTLGVKYMIGDSRKWKPYISLDAGIYFYNQSITGTITESDGTESTVDEKEKGNDTVLEFGLGIMRRLSRHWYLDLAAKYNILSDNKSITTDESGKVNTAPITANFASVTAGVQYHF